MSIQRARWGMRRGNLRFVASNAASRAVIPATTIQSEPSGLEPQPVPPGERSRGQPRDVEICVVVAKVMMDEGAVDPTTTPGGDHVHVEFGGRVPVQLINTTWLKPYNGEAVTV